MKKLIVTALIFFLLYSVSFAEDAIKLPDPVKTGGMPVLEAISNRQSAGDFADVELTPEQLIEKFKEEGYTEDQIVRAMHEKRRELGQQYKEAAPPLFLEYI